MCSVTPTIGGIHSENFKLEMEFSDVNKKNSLENVKPCCISMEKLHKHISEFHKVVPSIRCIMVFFKWFKV